MRKTIGRYKFSDSQRLALVDAGLLPSDSTLKSQTLLSRRFSVDEYMGMVEIGVLGREDRVELVDGVILEMAPIGRPHERRVNRLARHFVRMVPDDIEVNIQGTIRLNDDTGPEPDITLLSPEASLDEVNIAGPGGVLLVIEVSDSTLRTDRGEKARRYAASGIPELWVFVLKTHEVEVHRQPTPDGYADVQTYRRGDALSIQELPEITFPVDELLA